MLGATVFFRTDDEFLVICMTIVKHPYVLDFAGSQLDRPMDFPPEVMAEWLADKESEFDEDAWPKVLEILWNLEALGIYLTDINPRNISPPT